MHKFLLTIAALLACVAAFAADPTATDYTFDQCQGSLQPYPRNVALVATPDSLTPVYISHVGRHGSRYPAGSGHALRLQRTLRHADSLGTITDLGHRLLTLVDRVVNDSKGRWGALDSLGQSEQRAIAGRMMANYPEVFTDGTVNALSSYSPRSMMSMFSFVHQMDRLNNKLTFLTSTGRMNSALMRPFDVDEDYIKFREDNTIGPVYNKYFEEVCPLTAITRVLGRDYPFGDTEKAREIAIIEYYVVAGLEAMQIPSQMDVYFTRAEANAFWSCFNLRQYLQHTASTVSAIPADIAAQLVIDIIQKTDNAITGQNPAVADLRFGHAETVMPLASLIRLPGCYYLTNYFDTVPSHWRDFYVVPMAANVQFVLFKAKKSGNYYLRVALNEVPVPLLPNSKSVIIPWSAARNYLMECVPMHMSLAL
ncbi:MAG: hypothetical protein UHP27_06410 [Muribaculaceae bacterium]|nr:hypothetical protein [Muribaculaceae bacterium]